MTSDSVKILPPDQSFRTIKRKNGILIFSVSESGVALGDESLVGKDISGYPGGYHVFAEKVSLKDSFWVKELNSNSNVATISTHDLELLSKQSTLSASGENAESKTDINGKPSGSLSFYLENCRSDIVRLLELNAKGGKGANTREKKGNGGDGGRGGNIQWVAYSTFLNFLECLRVFNWSPISKSDSKSFIPDSTPLTRDSPYLKYLATSIAAAQQIPPLQYAVSGASDPKDLFSPLTKLDSKIKGGQLSSLTVKDARDALGDTMDSILEQFYADKIAIPSNMSVVGGNGGSVDPQIDAGERGSAGTPGTRGNAYSILLNAAVLEPPVDKKDSMYQRAMVFVHPQQCQMLYDRAMSYWYFGMNTRAIELLSRLLLRLCFIRVKPSIETNDPLAQAYTSMDTYFGTKNSLKTLDTILEATMRQLCVLHSGKVDYYAYGVDWVPRISYGEYHNYLKDAISVFKVLENAYIKYDAAKKDQDKRSDSIQGAKAKIDAQLSDIDGETKKLIENMKALNDQIQAAGPKVEQKHKEFVEQFKKFKDKVKEAHQLTAEQVFNAVSALTRVKDLPANVDRFKLAYEWAKKYPDDSDNLINKKVLIKKLQRSVVTSLNDFTADFSSDDLTGEFELDKRLPRFLIEETQLEDILADYSEASFADAGQELTKAFKAFTDALSARNGDILAYNCLIQNLTNLDEKAASLKEMRKANDNPTIDDDLDQMTEYMRMIFESGRARVMRYLSFGARALHFKILKQTDLISLTGLKNDIPLSLTSDILLSTSLKLDELLRTATEADSGSPALFPADWDKWSGKRRKLSDKELQTLLKQKKVDVIFDPVFPGVSPSSLASDFTNRCNVRVYRVRFILEGLKAKSDPERKQDPQMKSIILHTGSEVIVSRKGIASHFEHTPLNTPHTYSVDTDGKVTGIGDDGTLVNYVKTAGDKDGIFGAPGPFTTWQVDSSDAEWKNLETGDVKGGYLEFFGTNYAPWDARYKIAD